MTDKRDEAIIDSLFARRAVGLGLEPQSRAVIRQQMDSSTENKAKAVDMPEPEAPQQQPETPQEISPLARRYPHLMG